MTRARGAPPNREENPIRHQTGSTRIPAGSRRWRSRATRARAPAPEALLSGFRAQLARQGRAPGTELRYAGVLHSFFAALERPPTALSPGEIEAYLDEWRERFQARYGRAPALASYRGQVNALRSFYRYLERLGLLADERGQPLSNPLRALQCPPAEQTENDWLRPREDAALLACPGSVQERFTVALLRHTGMRVSEAASVTLADLELTPGQQALRVRRSKTAAGRRTIPILPAFLPTLREWLAELERLGLDRPQTPLLTTRHGSPLQHSFSWRIVKRVAHRAGFRPIPCTCPTAHPPHQPGCPRNQNGFNLSHVTPHTLRRTYASDLLNRGLRLEVVSKLLGHATTTITERAYAQLLDDTTRRELLQALAHAS